MTGSKMPRLRSAARGVEWPAVPSPRGRSVLSLLHQLERSERWTADALAAAQFRQLGRLLAHARETVPFYRGRLGDGGAAEAGAITPEAFAELPLLRRQDIQAAGEAMHSTRVPRGHGRVTEVFTSGTTGRPVRVLRTEISALFWSAFTVRDHLWHGRDVSGKLAVIRRSEKGVDPYPEGSRSRIWGPTSELFETGPAVSLNLNCSVAEQVDWLRRQRPDYLLTHPTNLYRLANHCLEGGVRLDGLRQAMTVSEAVRPGVREACKAAWDVGLTDIYTGRDVGYMALQCPDHDHYHVQSEGAVVEVLADDGGPAAPGELGRVVVTNLHNFAMPLIRYEIGDYAEAGGPCPCGRPHPVINRIIGREQDMITLANGEKRWTLLSTGNIEAFLEIAPVRQYQFAQKDFDTIEVRLAVERALTAAEKERIREWVVSKLDHPFAVEFAFVDEIRRTAAGKYQDFVSEVDAPPEPARRADA